MIPVLIEAALRSLLAGLAVAVGLRIFRVRNVLAQKAAWGLVLVSAFTMPLMLPITAQWHLVPAGVNVNLPEHPETLLEELQARLIAKAGSGGKAASVKAPAAQSETPKTEKTAAQEHAAAPRAAEMPAFNTRVHRDARPEQETRVVADGSVSSSVTPSAASAEVLRNGQSAAASRQTTISPIALILTFYGGISALFLMRIVVGLFATIRLWRTAAPVQTNELPPDAAFLHIRASSKVASPITIGSAILLPADYENWDSEKLRIVIAHERSHIRQGDFYLQVLASLYAALAWFSPLGWWIKHELAELGEAISDRAGMQEAASCTSYAQILLEFAAAPRQITIGVAMARPGSLSRRIERLLNDNTFRQCFAGGPRALVAVALVPLALFASTTLVRVQAAATTQPHSPGRIAVSTSEGAPAMPAAAQLNSEQTAATPAVPVSEALQVGDREPAQEPMSRTEEPAAEIVAAAAPAPAIRMMPVVNGAARAVEEGETLSFDRTLTVSGNAQLFVSTGSGNIHITRGSGSQIGIHGKIHVNREGSEEQARQIAANPPIEQSGDTIRVGQRHNDEENREQWRGISIDYEIEAPTGTVLAATSGSGDIVDEGVGQNAKLETGSGDIKATSLEGPFKVKTGSGNITAAQTGQGDVVAETGSGDIVLKDIHGSFHGETGSGDIKASGTPSATWNLQTGSGNIELWTGNAPVTLDASTGSGSVKTEHEMMVQGSLDQHHIKGELNGGGPTVRLQTGSGDVQIH